MLSRPAYARATVVHRRAWALGLEVGWGREPWQEEVGALWGTLGAGFQTCRLAFPFTSTFHLGPSGKSQISSVTRRLRASVALRNNGNESRLHDSLVPLQMLSTFPRLFQGVGKV